MTVGSASGVKRALGTRGPLRKITLYLVPFVDLPPDIAEYDRIFIREIPVFLASAGLQVIRVPEN